MRDKADQDEARGMQANLMMNQGCGELKDEEKSKRSDGICYDVDIFVVLGLTELCVKYDKGASLFDFFFFFWDENIK